jgi:hypothetical protein
MLDEYAEKHQAAVDEAVATGQMIPVSTDLSEAPDPLTAEQRARATAVWEARWVLETKTSAGAMAKPGSVPPSVVDLLMVADYIMGGREDSGIDVEQGRLD